MQHHDEQRTDAAEREYLDVFVIRDRFFEKGQKARLPS